VEEGSEVQKDLIKLFGIYTNGEELFDPYYQMKIKLDHISFFATVNYPENLAPLLKNNVKMRSLEDYDNEEKIEILNLKKKQIEENLQKIYGGEEEIISEKIIKELPKYIKEAGIRQAERVLREIEKEYIYSKENGKEFTLGNPKQ
jgi:ATP-dependent Lon protease